MEKKNQKRPSQDRENKEIGGIENWGDLNKRSSRISKKTKRILLVLAACFVFVLIAFNVQNLSPGNIVFWIEDKFLGISGGSGYPVDIIGTQVDANNFKLMERDLIVVSDTSFVALSASGTELTNRQHSFSAPILKTAGSKALIYNLQGTGYQTETRAKTIAKQTMPYRILTGAIAANGNYAIVTESKDYLGEMTVYSEDQSELYKYYFSEYYITDVCLSNDGKSAAAVGISTNGGALKSVLYLFHIKDQEPKVVFEYENNLMLSVEYCSDGNVIAVGDTLTSFVRPSKKEKQDFAYDKKSLTCFETDIDSGVVLSLSSTADNRNCQVISFDTSGKTTAQIETGRKVYSVAMKDSRIAVLSDGTIISYSSKGDQRGQYEVGNDAKKILLPTQGKAYVLGISEIKLFHLT